MNRISEITKRDILDIFRNGIEKDEIFQTITMVYPYYGRVEEIDFLKRLYELDKMPSSDSRFPNAEAEIVQHIVNNSDYIECWVFEDRRFQLMDGSDEVYLKFLCEIFHPAVRYEKGYWKEFLDETNRLLQNDGYELYPAKQISNHDIYDWRNFQPDEKGLHIPYSQRHKKEIMSKKISLSINRSTRNQIFNLMKKYDLTVHKTTETNWDYTTTIMEEMFGDIKQFYTPKCFDEKKKYVETDCIQDFIFSNYPYYVLDAIEMFSKNCMSEDFESQMNSILALNDLGLKLVNNKIEYTYDSQINQSSLETVQETGLKELLQDAIKYYNERNLTIAVEKLWDAFERLKTYYSPTLDKKKSADKIIENISGNKAPYIILFEKEFKELTTIGNDFRIRHHETTKIDIEDERHYEYFYKRGMSLVSTAIQYLNER